MTGKQEFVTASGRVFIDGHLVYGAGDQVPKEQAETLGLTEDSGEVHYNTEAGELEARRMQNTGDAGDARTQGQGGALLGHASLSGADDGTRQATDVSEDAGHEVAPGVSDPAAQDPEERQAQASTFTEDELPARSAPKPVWVAFAEAHGYDGDANVATADDLKAWADEHTR